MKFFVNAPGRKRRKARKAKSSARRRRRRTPPRGAGGRFVSRKKGRKTVARKRRTRKRSSARRTTARRRSTRRRRSSPVTVLKRRRVYATNPRRRRRRRRSYRRNPGLVNTMLRGVMDALAVTGGKVANNLVAKNLPFTLPLPGVAGDVVKSLGIATLVSWGATRFVKGDRARLVTAGAFQSVVEGLIRSLNVPYVSTALGEYDILGNSYNGLGAYARPRIAAAPAARAMGAYPAPEYEGDQFAYANAG